MIAALGACRVRMHFTMTGVDHQPFVIRLVDQTLKKFLPDARIAPSDKAAMRIAPSAIFRRQVAPGRTGPQNPEHRIDKQAVVLGNAAAVRVTRDGAEVDLTPFRRANVARFALSSDGSLAPVVD